MQDIPLVDKYDAYQVLATNWQTIVNDIETIQTEGLEAVRVVETAYKLVKKGDEELEVPDGLKGRILPFELVQHEMFQKELDALDDLQTSLEEIGSTLNEVISDFTEDEAEAYLDEDDNTKLNKNAIKADAKAKGDAVDVETREKLKKILALWDKQTKTSRNIKAAKADLVMKTEEAIKNLSDKEAEKLLHEKWITPISKALNYLLANVLINLKISISNIEVKYSEPYVEITSKLQMNENQLTGLIGNLVGDEYTIKGLTNLRVDYGTND